MISAFSAKHHPRDSFPKARKNSAWPAPCSDSTKRIGATLATWTETQEKSRTVCHADDQAHNVDKHGLSRCYALENVFQVASSC